MCKNGILVQWAFPRTFVGLTIFFLLPLIFICVFYRNCHFMSFSHFFLLIFLHVLSDFMGSLHDEFVICWLYSLLISCTIFLSHSYSCDFLQSFWITIQSKYITSEGNEFRTLFFKFNWFVFHILQNLLSEVIQLRIVTGCTIFTLIQNSFNI